MLRQHENGKCWDDFTNADCAERTDCLVQRRQSDRTFCYASDTTLASLKCALYASYDIFNIGNDAEEMAIRELAEIYRSVVNNIFGYKGNIIFREHTDKHYNTDNPQSRRPDLTKIKTVLDYTPSVDTRTGVERYLRYVEMSGNDDNGS